MENASAAGPYDQWPCQRGFDRYYGFLEGETDQFYPELVYDNHSVEPPGTPDEGYHLSEDLVDHAIGFIHDTTSIRPDRPFFTYLAFGAMHAPHQAPAAYLEKYRGRFDDGWDVARDRWFARQLEMGLLPADTELAPRNPGVEPWDTLPDNQRRLAARLQEAFAAFLEHTDAQIGRLVDGAGAAGPAGQHPVHPALGQRGQPGGRAVRGHARDEVLQLPGRDARRGGRADRRHRRAPQPRQLPVGLGPGRQHPVQVVQAEHPRGRRARPAHRALARRHRGDAGELRDQFHHVNDIVPTIYETLGHRGARRSTAGSSRSRSRASPCATPSTPPTRPSRKQVQYYEMMGHRAIYADGWKAVTRHQPGVPFDDDDWELYHLAEDRSECHNLAADHARQGGASWSSCGGREAEEHGVLPLDDRTIELFSTRYRDRSPHPTDRHYSYFPPMSPLPGQVAPALGGRGWDMAATIERPDGAGGVLYATGTENSGLSLFVQDDRLVFDYNCFGDHHVVESEVPVPVGPSVVGVRFRRTGKGGAATLRHRRLRRAETWTSRSP